MKFVALILLASLSRLLSAETVGLRPNIIFVLADDFGRCDLHCYGHPHARTPIWTSGRNTEEKKFEDSEFIKDIRVRAVAAPEVGKWRPWACHALQNPAHASNH